jgi:hypothetical protein
LFLLKSRGYWPTFNECYTHPAFLMEYNNKNLISYGKKKFRNKCLISVD